MLLKLNIDLENRHNHQPLAPFPHRPLVGFGKGGGIGPFADFDKMVHD
jgi:hypothetical protein